MREFETLTSGYAACAAAESPFPFVVRQSVDFAACASVAAIRAQLMLEEEVKGLDEKDGSYGYQSGREALANYDAGKRGVNIIDAEAGWDVETWKRTAGALDLMPAEMQRLPGSQLLNTRLLLAYVLSPLLREGSEGSLGALHIDPPLGSGWQYVAVGCKTWFVLQPHETFSSAERCRKVSKPPDIAAISAVTGVLTATLQAGDFLSFPCCWAHCVATHEPSVGLSGYSVQPNARGEQ